MRTVNKLQNYTHINIYVAACLSVRISQKLSTNVDFLKSEMSHQQHHSIWL